MNDLGKKSLLSAALGLSLALAAGGAVAGEPPPPKAALCHNIGGPEDLGANCDGTGTCSYQLVDEYGNLTGSAINVPLNHFLGILIPPTSAGAMAAHLAHGDGYALLTFDPPLHLASTGQNHQASNVECYAERAITTQPPEPGN